MLKMYPCNASFITCCSTLHHPPPQALDFMVKKFMLADVVTVIGTLDVVFGEIDR